jgi:hypothetical protein
VDERALMVIFHAPDQMEGAEVLHVRFDAVGVKNFRLDVGATLGCD